MSFTKNDFGADFNWGVSTAAYQIEGAHNVDGKGASIWDIFSQKKRNILLGENGNESCNFYEKFETDIALIRQLNIPIYRFSISWSRILPEGLGGCYALGNFISLGFTGGITAKRGVGESINCSVV